MSGPDNKAPAFDFQAAVEKARQDYPDDTRDILFLDPDVPADHQKLTDLIESLTAPEVADILPADQRERLLSEVADAPHVLPDTKAALVQIILDTVACVFPLPSRGLRLFSMRVAAVEETAIPPQFAFDHELGHLLSPFKMPAPENTLAYAQHKNLSEHVADSFATLRGLSHKTCTRETVDDIARHRTLCLWMDNDLVHATAAGLDILLHDTSIDFPSLTPEVIRAVAADHARRFACTEHDLSLLSETFAPLSRRALHEAQEFAYMTPDCGLEGEALMLHPKLLADNAQRLAAQTLRIPLNAPDFYYGARLLCDIFQNSGIRHAGALHPVRTDTDDWRRIRKALKTKLYDAQNGPEAPARDTPEGTLIAALRDKLRGPAA